MAYRLSATVTRAIIMSPLQLRLEGLPWRNGRLLAERVQSLKLDNILERTFQLEATNHMLTSFGSLKSFIFLEAFIDRGIYLTLCAGQIG